MSSSTADLTIIFGKSILSSLTREKESNLLLGLSIDIENLIKSSNDSVTISNFLSKYLFNLSNLFKLNKDNTNNIETNLSEDIIFTIRSTLIERILDKIFKLNDKLKSFDQVYNIPQNYLKRLIDLANTYQKQQNPYYLPPRTKFDREQNIDLDLDPFLIGTSSGLNSNSKHLNHFFKSTFFPNKLYHTLTYHSEEVWFTKFSPSGRFMISGSLDEKLIIYDVINNFKVLKILQPTAALDNEVFVPFSSKPASEKSKAVIYCCWDPQERYLVSCCLDTVVRVWYIGGIHNLIGKRSRKESVITGTGATTTTTTTNTTDNNNEFKLVSCFTLGQEIKTWTCEFLPTSSNLARPHFIIGSPDKVLKGFDVDGVELFDFYANIEDDEDEDEEEDDDEDKEKDGNNGGNKKIEDKEGDIQMRDETEDTNSTTTTNGNGKSKTKFDKSSSLIKSKLENKFNRINDITITPDGKFLITADSDHKLHFYKIPNLLSPESTTKRIASITLSGRLTSCSISKTGKFLLISCAPEELQVWDISGLNTGDYAPILYRRYFGHSQSGYIIRSAFGYLVEDEDEEQIILTGSDTGYIYFFKLHTSQLITRVKGHDGLCNCVDWNRFGKRATINSVDLGKLWSSVGDDNLVKIWGPF
ncbi:WD40-repeat-containing domain protein [Scheffersomyces amazonensis]|uniref:WD40-repeat-containing domain protein n=1 Tax=Scheffersomyces amazonensis TaxID=1078765 RepID=UPI00315D787A